MHTYEQICLHAKHVYKWRPCTPHQHMHTHTHAHRFTQASAQVRVRMSTCRWPRQQSSGSAQWAAGHLQVKSGGPPNQCHLTCRPFLFRQRCRPVTMLCGQWSVTVGGGRHGLTQHFGSNAIVNGVNANYVAPCSLQALIASTYVEHSLLKAALTALHRSSTSRATGLLPGRLGNVTDVY